jgi:hypothetical protein
MNKWIAEGRVISRKINGIRVVLVDSIRALEDDPVPGSRPGPRTHTKGIRKEE